MIQFLAYPFFFHHEWNCALVVIWIDWRFFVRIVQFCKSIEAKSRTDKHKKSQKHWKILDTRHFNQNVWLGCQLCTNWLRISFLAKKSSKKSFVELQRRKRCLTGCDENFVGRISLTYLKCKSLFLSRFHIRNVYPKNLWWFSAVICINFVLFFLWFKKIYLSEWTS